MTTTAESGISQPSSDVPQPQLWRAIPVAVMFLVGCVVTGIVLAAARIFRIPKLLETFPPYFHRFCCRLFGLKVVVEGHCVGQGPEGGPVLYVSNHASYLDVLVLGGLLRGVFTAKSEVAKWPVIGWLASLGRTVYLERRPRRAGDQISALQQRFIERGNVILFAEGTSSDGSEVLPFRSSLFAAAQAEHIQVQPVTVAYVRLPGQQGSDQQMSQPQRNLFSWFLPDPATPVPNAPFAAHMWRVMGLPEVEVRVRFHPPVASADYSSRKALAEHSESSVREGLERLLKGITPPSGP